MDLSNLEPGLALLAASDASSFGAIAWLFWKQREEHERALAKAHEINLRETRDLAARLADFKLEIARNYASIAYLKDVENRLTAHLLRIEAKLGANPVADARL
ncbi:MAG: hypothetical protein O9320_14425 [Magnetospirillum sp.]|jgi:hypothetical protein|nr:hypothetical protein [Magnetospirillum sp.]